MTTRAGEVYENPVTGERAVVRVGTEESGGELLVNDLYVRPGGAVMGEHVHPNIEESFTVVRGRLGYRLDGREGVAGPGQRLHVPPGTTHDWWNAGEEVAHVVVEISPAARFEEMILNAFGLAQEGKTDEGQASPPAAGPVRPGVRRRRRLHQTAARGAEDPVWSARARRLAARLQG